MRTVRRLIRRLSPRGSDTVIPGATILLPEPRQLSRAHASCLIVLPAGSARHARAVTELGHVLATWSLSPGLARRLLAPAPELLRADQPLELYAEADDQLLTVELWIPGGERVYGIDDWIGSGVHRLAAEPAEAEVAAG